MKSESARFVSGCLGNLFDHYDMALYKCLSPFLAPPLFFPESDPITALIYVLKRSSAGDGEGEGSLVDVVEGAAHGHAEG